MDKVGNGLRNKLLFLLGIFILAVAFSAAMPGAEAGTVLAPPEPVDSNTDPKTDRPYAESRFGSPPQRIKTGVDNTYAAKEVEDLEASDESDASSAGGSRAPAGLEFSSSGGSGSAGRVQPTERDRVRKALELTGTPQGADKDATLDRLTGGAQKGNPFAATPRASAAEAAISRKGVQEVALIASDLGYFPRTVFVARDVPVRMFVTGASKSTLCIMMDSFSVRKQVRSQKIEEITFTPNVPGKYRYYCPVNGMEGVMIVKELASNPADLAAAVPSAQAGDAVKSQAAAPSRAPAGAPEYWSPPESKEEGDLPPEGVREK